MSTAPKWHLAGDWFDICSCDIPCPCEFAQAPTNNACVGMLAWHIREGHYGEVGLEGLNLVALAAFEGNIWSGEAKLRMGLFIDERADEPQRQALQTVFSGQAGGWPATIAGMIDEFRGVEFMPIAFEIADDLAFWRAEIPGRVLGRAEALSGPTTPPGQRVQMLNPLARRSAPARSRPGAARSKCEPKASGSNGLAKGAPASTSRSTGPDLIPSDCRGSSNSLEAPGLAGHPRFRRRNGGTGGG